jgi:hypothetical protein
MMLSQIPGLVQRTTPMVRGDQRGTITHLSLTAWVVVIDAPDDDPDASLAMSSGNNDPKGPGYWKWDVDTDHVTGRSHLAAWLTYKAPRRTSAEHAENCAALGATPESYAAALDCALRCLPVDAAGVDLLRRYALRVGVPVG